MRTNELLFFRDDYTYSRVGSQKQMMQVGSREGRISIHRIMARRNML